MGKHIISTKRAPAAVGPYSQGVLVEGLLFTAGQVALDPATGKVIDGDVAAQTEQVMLNLQAILNSAGATLDDVVKTTVFLQEMDHFSMMNEVYAQFFAGDPPARSTVQVAGLPLGVLVEIEAIAQVPQK
ncbi:MAG TPA: RidA family protein [candidate division Zixibacteria bacterium]|nr:RidA family protein [candidate division Zixibacteria bacterium]